jgi:hypothetical protein
VKTLTRVVVERLKDEQLAAGEFMVAGEFVVDPPTKDGNRWQSCYAADDIADALDRVRRFFEGGS